MANAQQGKNPFVVTRQVHHKYGGEAITLSGNLTLTRRDGQYLAIDPNGSDRTVTLPAEEGNEGLYFYLRNTGTAGEDITVNNDAAGAVATINAGEWAMVLVSAAGAWIIPAQGVGQTLQYLDDVAVIYGSASGGDADVQWVSASNDWRFDNRNATGSTLFDLGTDTSATDFQVRNNSGTAILTVAGDSSAIVAGTLQVTGALNFDAALDHDVALGSAPGDGTNLYVSTTDADGAATGLNVSVEQLTNVRTSTRVAGVKSKVTSLSGDTANVDYAAFEAAVTVGEANADHSVIYSEDAFDFLIKVLASGDGGVTVSGDGMTGNPETDTEAGYITIDVAGTSYQIPFYTA